MAVWLEEVDLSDFFHNDELSFEGKRDLIVERLRESEWAQVYGEDSLLGIAINGMADAIEVGDFDYYWDDVYNVADRDRVWIKT